MLHPSYTDLMNIANSEVEQGEQPVVNSRYSIDPRGAFFYETQREPAGRRGHAGHAARGDRQLRNAPDRLLPALSL